MGSEAIREVNERAAGRAFEDGERFNRKEAEIMGGSGEETKTVFTRENIGITYAVLLELEQRIKEDLTDLLGKELGEGSIFLRIKDPDDILNSITRVKLMMEYRFGRTLQDLARQVEKVKAWKPPDVSRVMGTKRVSDCCNVVIDEALSDGQLSGYCSNCHRLVVYLDKETGKEVFIKKG